MGNFAKTTLIIIVILLAAVAIYLFLNTESRQNANSNINSINSAQDQAQNTALPEIQNNEMAAVNGSNETAKIKTFNISAKNFEYSLKEIKVNKGDTVKIVLSIEGGFHDWVVDEFNARTKKINAGEVDAIQFIADKSGTFEYYCSVGTHRQMGMVGNLIVE